MTDLTVLLPVLLACGITALATSLGWFLALHREQQAHADTVDAVDYAIEQWAATHKAHTAALATISAAGINGRQRRHLKAVR
jgi:hypothetical protein